jgi:large repetitive protein
VWRRTVAGDWVRIAVLAPSARSYSDTTASPNTTYFYKVRANNDDFVSDWSNDVMATTGP